MGRFEDEGVTADKKPTPVRGAGWMCHLILVQNLAFWLELIAISLYFCKK